MSVIVSAYAEAWRPQDRRTRCEWAHDNVVVPNMARASRFDVSVAPWQQEPIEFSGDTRVREMVLLWPTGAGKSNFVDVFTCYHAAEEEGDLLLAVQGNKEAEKYVEKRALPALKGIPSVAEALASMPRHSTKKGKIALPDKTIYWGGANETNAQATSCRVVIVDEAWMADHGLLEQFRARLHSRWNRLAVFMGQGGMAKIEIGGQLVDTEWNSAWLRTDQREWCFQCPQCGEIQRYGLRQLKYEQGDPLAPLDETAVEQSATYQCVGTGREKPTCDAVFPDNVNVRRDLSRTGRYVVQHEKHRQHHHGWHINALGIWYETWGELAVLHAKGHRARKAGDNEPLKLMRQKRMAEHVREAEAVPVTSVGIGEYELEDYMDGRRIDGETFRCGFADKQREHYYLVIRAYRPDGSSQRVYVGKVSTDEQLRDLQQKFGVPERCFAVDSGKYTDQVYNLCARFGWVAFKGDHVDSYKFLPRNGRAFWKYYSPTKTVFGSNNKPCSLVLFSNLQVKRILERLRNGPQKLEEIDGKPVFTDVPKWEVEKNVSEEFHAQMFSEMERDTRSKETGRYSRAFVQIGNRENHIWDCEVGCTVFALANNVLSYTPPQEDAKPPTEPKAA